VTSIEQTGRSHEGRLEQNGRSHEGRLSLEISNLVVRLCREYTGRGPTKARAFVNGAIVVCVTADTMTKGERRLTERGEDGIVTSLRHKFQATMRDDLVGGVELLTGRRIVSVLSDHDPHADCGVEVFVLDAPPEAPAEDG
jgi:uncharacterized protein YbcI